MSEATTYISFSDVRPFLGLGCCVLSCYNSSSLDFLGCVSRNSICCIRNELILCKPSRKPDAWCNCLTLDCEFIPPGTLYQTQSQLLCIDFRLALPPDSRYAPCICTILSCTLFYKNTCTCHFCAKGDALEGQQQQRTVSNQVAT